MMSEEVIIYPALVSALSDLLLTNYNILRPVLIDYEHRTRMFQMLSAVAKDIFSDNRGFPILEALGSFTMDLFTASSDLDLSVNLNHDYPSVFTHDENLSVLQKNLSVLDKFTKALRKEPRKGLFSRVTPLLAARVPILSVEDYESGIECDISVNNKDGIKRSLILKIVSSMDGRFRILYYLMKAWAQKQGVYGTQKHALNSLSIACLVVVHLQTRHPPILPPLSTLLRDGDDISSVRKIACGYKHSSARRNDESVAELFDTLLSDLVVEQNSWKHGLCASAFEGSWIIKVWKTGVASMSVEDFLDRSDNCTRAVNEEGKKKIYAGLWKSLYHLKRFLNDQIDDVWDLSENLFGPIRLNLEHSRDKGTQSKRRLLGEDSAAGPNNPIMMKRARTQNLHRQLSQNGISTKVCYSCGHDDHYVANCPKPPPYCQQPHQHCEQHSQGGSKSRDQVRTNTQTPRHKDILMVSSAKALQDTGDTMLWTKNCKKPRKHKRLRQIEQRACAN